MKKRFRPIFILLMLLLLAVMLTACLAESDNELSNDELLIFFIDVGKGDAALIGIPDDKWIMIDVGHEEEHAEVIRILKNNSIKELEAIFISHPHNDHVSALYKVLEHVECKTIYSSPVEFKNHSPLLREMVGTVPIKMLTAGDELNISGLKINIIGPNGVFEEENNNSLVMLIDWKGKKALFTGDQQTDAEMALIKKGWNIKCDILKAGHHGQDTASSDEFLKKAGARFCIITNNLKGKEYDKAANRLSKFGSRVFMLGTTGTLLFEISEKDIRFYGITPPPDTVKDVNITSIDTIRKSVTIKSNDESVSLYGWSIGTGRGEDTYFFDDDAVINKGESLVITSEFFGKFKKNKAVLYDQYGRELSSFYFDDI